MLPQREQNVKSTLKQRLELIYFQIASQRLTSSYGAVIAYGLFCCTVALPTMNAFRGFLSVGPIIHVEEYMQGHKSFPPRASMFYSLLCFYKSKFYFCTVFTTSFVSFQGSSYLYCLFVQSYINVVVCLCCFCAREHFNSQIHE